jgi:hypothetical protein
MYEIEERGINMLKARKAIKSKKKLIQLNGT